jgi:ABC-type antimicrobial peptide transport system permease subunit
MFSTKTASFEVKGNGLVIITQLSTNKSIEVKITSMIDLITNFKPCFTTNGLKLNFHQERKHLSSEQNIINTYLTKGLDLAVISYFENKLEEFSILNNANVSENYISMNAVPFDNLEITEDEFNAISKEENTSMQISSNRANKLSNSISAEQFTNDDIFDESYFAQWVEQQWYDSLTTEEKRYENKLQMYCKKYHWNYDCPYEKGYAEQEYIDAIMKIAEYDKKCDDWMEEYFPNITIITPNFIDENTIEI